MRWIENQQKISELHTIFTHNRQNEDYKMAEGRNDGRWTNTMPEWSLKQLTRSLDWCERKLRGLLDSTGQTSLKTNIELACHLRLYKKIIWRHLKNMVLTVDGERNPFADRWRYPVRGYAQVGTHVVPGHPAYAEYTPPYTCNLKSISTIQIRCF